MTWQPCPQPQASAIGGPTFAFPLVSETVVWPKLGAAIDTGNPVVLDAPLAGTLWVVGKHVTMKVLCLGKSDNGTARNQTLPGSRVVVLVLRQIASASKGLATLLLRLLFGRVTDEVTGERSRGGFGYRC